MCLEPTRTTQWELCFLAWGNNGSLWWGSNSWLTCIHQLQVRCAITPLNMLSLGLDKSVLSLMYTKQDHDKGCTKQDHVKGCTKQDHVKGCTKQDHVKGCTKQDHVKGWDSVLISTKSKLLNTCLALNLNNICNLWIVWLYDVDMYNSISTWFKSTIMRKQKKVSTWRNLASRNVKNKFCKRIN